ncbi:MAG: hypothetical protein AAF975_04890, partial [Spirochaetota bacterium]
MSIRKIILVLLYLALCLKLWSQVHFSYKHYNGQKYHIIAQVDEQVLRNGQTIYRTQILNRIAIEVKELRGQDAWLDVNYQISEEAENGKFFSWAKESRAEFSISPQGIYKNLAPDAVLPSLRNVPSFPDRALQTGEGWNAPGIEIHDLSEIFGIPARLRFHFSADYMYRGEEIFQGRKLKHITLFYSISEDVRKQLPQNLLHYRDTDETLDIPRSVRARHSIELYWDSERGLPVFQKEDFEVSYLLRNGETVTFRGRS